MGECVTLVLPRSHRPGADSHGGEDQTLSSHKVQLRCEEECGMSNASS